MIRKFAAYGFILLANIVILAHTVVPHHHHQNIACVEDLLCPNNNIEHKHRAQSDNHQQDDGSSTNCTLKQAVIVPSIQGKEETECVVCSLNHFPDLHFNLPYSGNEALSYHLVIASVPDVPVYFSSYSTTSISLRAPPRV